MRMLEVHSWNRACLMAWLGGLGLQLASLVVVSHIEFRLWLGSSADIGRIHLVGQWFGKTPVAVHHKHYPLCLPAQANLNLPYVDNP